MMHINLELWAKQTLSSWSWFGLSILPQQLEKKLRCVVTRLFKAWAIFVLHNTILKLQALELDYLYVRFGSVMSTHLTHEQVKPIVSVPV